MCEVLIYEGRDNDYSDTSGACRFCRGLGLNNLGGFKCDFE